MFLSITFFNRRKKKKEEYRYLYIGPQPTVTTFYIKQKMTEKQIEQKLAKRVKALGGIALKLNPLGMDGIPDRLILLPKGIAFFVETKAPGKKPRALQVNRMKQLERLGFSCFLLDDDKQIDEVIKNGIRSS